VRHSLLAALAFIIATIPIAASAGDDTEMRLYFDAEHAVIEAREGHPLTLAPFVRTEERFGDQGLDLLKVFGGIRITALYWLAFQCYYAHKDFFNPGHRQANMAVGDIIFTYEKGPFRLKNRNGNEWHITDGFYRYRGYVEARYTTPAKWLRLWAAEEIRFDSDQARINENDVRAGLEFGNERVVARLFYFWEANRRERTHWNDTNIVGVSIALKL